MVEHFESERLTLRALTPGDVDLLVALDGDPAVMHYINGGKATARAEIEEVVRSTLGYRWLAFERSTTDFIGWFELRPSGGGEEERELGYRLRRETWGRGYATEGSRAVVAVAFTDLGAVRVWAQTMTVNTRSRAVMAACGMRFVRTFRGDWLESIAGTELGDVEYEVLKVEWEAARQSMTDQP